MLNSIQGTIINCEDGTTTIDGNKLEDIFKGHVGKQAVIVIDVSAPAQPVADEVKTAVTAAVNAVEALAAAIQVELPQKNEAVATTETATTPEVCNAQ